MTDEVDDYYYCAVASDHPPKPPTSSCCDDQVMRHLCQNGQTMIQDKRSHQKSEDYHPLDFIPAVVAGGSPPHQLNHHDPSLHPQHQHNDDNLFIQEDEMATWLLSDLCSDLLLPSSSTSPIVLAPSTVASHPARPPPAVPPPRRFDSFGHFSMLNRPRETTAIEATVVDSRNAPMVARVSNNAAVHDVARVGAESNSAGVRDAAKCDLTVTSSSGATSASASMEPIPPVKSQKVAPPLPSTRKTTTDVPEERKRIENGGEGGERHKNGEDEHKEGKKHVRSGWSSTKRSRAAEVHNLSERRRRDRINEKMRTLQKLIPRCSKADKASLLDKAIEYLKSLQMQVQLMSMGWGMMPMMYQYPGLQQYMPRMGIGVGMEMGMNRPMVQLPHVFTGAGGAGPPMGPRFHFPALQTPSSIPAPINQLDTAISSVSPHNSNHPRMSGFMDLYQQFVELGHMHSPLPQANTSCSDLATTSKAGEN